MNTHIHTRMHAHTQKHTHTHTYTHTHTHTRTHTHARTHIHTQIHTHNFPQLCWLASYIVKNLLYMYLHILAGFCKWQSLVELKLVNQFAEGRMEIFISQLTVLYQELWTLDSWLSPYTEKFLRGTYFAVPWILL